MIKKLVIILFLSLSAVFAQKAPVDKARGVFISFGVGPRLPVNYFANSTDVGYGFNVEISYTDNEFIPVFLLEKLGSINTPVHSHIMKLPIIQIFQLMHFRLVWEHGIISHRLLKMSCFLCLLLKSQQIILIYKNSINLNQHQVKAIIWKIFPSSDLAPEQVCPCS